MDSLPPLPGNPPAPPGSPAFPTLADLLPLPPALPITAHPGFLERVWPRLPQLALAFLLGLTTTLLAVQASAWLRPGREGSVPGQAAAPERPVVAYRIDLNRASRAELLQLPGVGPRMADRIEAYRDEHGGFRNVAELQEVSGIGPIKLERLKPLVCVTRESEDEEDDPLPPRPSGKKGRKRPAGDMAASTADPPAPRKPSTKADRITAPIDVNKATAAELQQLPGIGPKMAQRIIDERTKRPFQSVDDLRRVSGIGPKTLEKLRPFVKVGGKSLEVVTAE